MMVYRDRRWFQGEKRARDSWTCLENRRGMKGFRTVFISCLLVLSGSLLLPISLTGETLDRLFFTPQERVYLEKLRWASPESLTLMPNQQENAVVPENKPQVYSLGGTVTKKTGVQAIWLNGVKHIGTDLPKNVEMYPPFMAGQVLLRVPETDTSYALRPGQTLNVSDGKIREPYERVPVVSVPDSKPVLEPTPLTEPSSEPVQTPGNPSASKP